MKIKSTKVYFHKSVKLKHNLTPKYSLIHRLTSKILSNQNNPKINNKNSQINVKFALETILLQIILLLAHVIVQGPVDIFMLIVFKGGLSLSQLFMIESFA